MKPRPRLLVRNWLWYTSLCWLVVTPVYAVHIYLYYLGAGAGLSLLDILLISLQDIVIWMLLAPLVAMFYQRVDVDLPARAKVFRYVAAGLGISVLHVAIDGLVNTGISFFRGNYLGFYEFWVHVGFAKLFPNAMIFSILILSLALYDRRRAGTASLAETADDPPLEASGAAAGRLLVKEKGSVVNIPYAQIEYVESAGNYCCIHFAGNTQIVRHTLSRLDTELPKPAFVRIHRSTLVNLRHVREFSVGSHGDGEVLLDDNTRLRVSRRYRGPLDAAYEQTAAAG